MPYIINYTQQSIITEEPYIKTSAWLTVNIKDIMLMAKAEC